MAQNSDQPKNKENTCQPIDQKEMMMIKMMVIRGDDDDDMSNSIDAGGDENE